MLINIENLAQSYAGDPLDFVSERYIYRVETYIGDGNMDVNVEYLNTVRELKELNEKHSLVNKCFYIDILEFCEELKLNNEYTLYEDNHLSIIIIRELK